jgi:signal peptidase II
MVDNKYIKLILIAGLVIALDQASKFIVAQAIPFQRSVQVVPGFFNLTHIHNPGGAFGFMATQNPVVRKILFLVVSSLAACLVLWFYKNTPKTHPFLAVGFALIFGGAVGNLIDRFRFGQVVDFLDFYLGTLRWPAFNVADSAITIGIIIFIGHLLFKKMPE